MPTNAGPTPAPQPNPYQPEMYPPGPPQGPQSKKPTWIIFVIVGVVVLGLIIAALVWFLGKSKGSATSSGGAVEVNVGAWELEVSEPVDMWPSIQERSSSADAPDPGMGFYGVSVSGIHTASEELDPFMELQLVFVADDGEEYTSESCGVLPDDAAFIDEIAANEPFTGNFCTVSPADASGDWYFIDFMNSDDRVQVGSR